MEMYTFPHLALPHGKGKPLPLVAVSKNTDMQKKRQKTENRKRNKVHILSARFTDMEYNALEKRRKDAGVSVSRFIRSVMLTGKVVQRISRADAEILRKLAGEANNLNQLARKANAGGYTKAAMEMVILNRKIADIIKQLSDDWKNKQGGNF